MAADMGVPEGFKIGSAIDAMRDGKFVSRRGWNGQGMFLALQVPDVASKMTMPYIYITVAGGCRLPWTASQTDLLAKDWFIFEPPPEK